MRELKFKAWDTVKKQWLFDGEPFGIIGEVMAFDRIYVYLGENRDCSKGTINFLHEIELVQFTGLTDPNGVEIWEGDILNDPNYAEDEWERSIVKYYDKYARFGLEFYSPWGGEGYTGAEQDIHRFVHNGCYVIGNIYQNPELLS